MVCVIQVGESGVVVCGLRTYVVPINLIPLQLTLAVGQVSVNQLQ